MSVRQNRIDQVAKYAEKDFSTHKVKVLLDTPDYKHYYCSGDSGFSWFNVVIYPDYLVVSGDLGDFIWWRPKTNMLRWAKGGIDSLGYFEEKIQAGNARDSFDAEVALEWINDERALLNAERVDALEIEDDDELNRIDKRLATLDDLMHLIHDEHLFKECIYEEYYDDPEILSCFWNYSYRFLLCREALKLLFSKI